MKIGEIKSQLLLANEDLRVYFDFCGCVPTTIGSWRGDYSKPAIGWEATGYLDTVPTVADILAVLNAATSKDVQHEGYKGGWFSYADENTLHVDNYGCYTNTQISSIEIADDEVILHTHKTIFLGGDE